MKRIISLWLAALMLTAQPIQAAVCVGFGQGAGGSGTLVLDDTLYEASSISIDTHTVAPGPGGAWYNHATATANVSTGGALSNSTATSMPYNAITPFADGYVVVEGVTNSTLRAFGPSIRWDGASVNGYVVMLKGDSTLTLSRIDGGSPTAIGTPGSCGTHSITTTYEVTITASGTTISASAREPGGEVLCTTSATDATYSSGVVGMRMINTAPRVTSIKAYSND